MDVFYSRLLNYSILIITQLIAGKKGAFLFAILRDMNLYVVSLVIILSDLGLMVAVARLFQTTVKRVFPFTLLQHKADKIEQKMKGSALADRLIKIGKAGTLVITAVPFAGGVWSGVVLAKILQLDNEQTYWLVGIGSVIGCLIFLLAAEGAINFIF